LFDNIAHGLTLGSQGAQLYMPKWLQATVPTGFFCIGTDFCERAPLASSGPSLLNFVFPNKLGQ
jgi:hypothetical protein